MTTVAPSNRREGKRKGERGKRQCEFIRRREGRRERRK
jgi:hypothetical protein